VLTKQELCDQLKIKQLKHLFFYKDKNSSKLYAVKIEDENGSRAVLIQRFMELLDLKSNQFELTSTPTTFTFSGQGSGLGVGLCLKTAEALAEKGADYKKILETCYPSIKMALLDK
jgi:stage II sporulation protein D